MKTLTFLPKPNPQGITLGALSRNTRHRPRQTECDIFHWTMIMQNYLNQKGVCVSNNGMPQIPEAHFLTDVPEDCDMFPITKRWFPPSKSNTILCSFEKDEYIYSHVRPIIAALEKGDEQALERVLSPYRQFLAVCGFDFSVCRNSSSEEQAMFLLLSQLVNAVFALNGIRLVANFRLGTLENLGIIQNFPRNVVYATGTLGCRDHYHSIGEVSLRARILILQPTMLLVYGPIQRRYSDILDDAGVVYKNFTDYRRRTHKVQMEVK